MTYQNSMMMNLGYNTYLLGSTGTISNGIAANSGVKIQDIETVASYGGLTATNLKDANGKIEIRPDGKDYNGNPVMIGVGNIETGHALIVKKIVAHANGNFYYHTRDPQNGDVTGVYVHTQVSNAYGIAGGSSGQ